MLLTEGIELGFKKLIRKTVLTWDITISIYDKPKSYQFDHFGLGSLSQSSARALLIPHR